MGAGQTAGTAELPTVKRGVLFLAAFYLLPLRMSWRWDQTNRLEIQCSIPRLDLMETKSQRLQGSA